MIPNLEKPNIEWDFSKKIFIKNNVLNEMHCEELIRSNETLLAEGVDKYPELFTTSFHSCLLPLNHQVHNELQSVYQEIIDFFRFDIDFVEPYELKRYKVDDYFGQHIDNYYSLKIDIDRKITTVIFLNKNDSYNGGDLKILGKPIPGNQGTLVAFPSFFPHNVDKIISGERWSLIAWLWGNYWK